ncbi:MAG: F0F1 ATP synthase subunit A, partial [Prevotella sp.]|nr:F0F1 ATP synthase subunit A [Prevotella sp.]
MRYLLLCLTFLLTTATPVSASESEGIDVKEIVLGHLSDAYEWHITTIGGKHISIPLPVIVRSEATGKWQVFCSSRMEEAAEEGHDYNGFYFNEEKNGKIYERLADGSSVRPWDLSITKSVLQIWIVVIIMLAIFLGCARWYKKHDPTKDVPKGFVGMVEMLVMSINDDLIKDSIGEKHYRAYAPYLLTAFFFILITNMLGLLPIFPGGANVTGNINITFFLALCTMLAVNIFGNKEYWKEIFWPDVPMFLKAYPAA